MLRPKGHPLLWNGRRVRRLPRPLSISTGPIFALTTAVALGSPDRESLRLIPSADRVPTAATRWLRDRRTMSVTSEYCPTLQKGVDLRRVIPRSRGPARGCVYQDFLLAQGRVGFEPSLARNWTLRLGQVSEQWLQDRHRGDPEHDCRRRSHRVDAQDD